MKINSINIFRQQNFGRAFNAEEEKLCKETVKEAKEYLGLENLALICHGPSYPNSKSFVGSINSKEAKEFEDFINMFGFDSVQQGPNGKISPLDVSPYTSETYARNTLFIDFEKLNSEEYQKLIDDKTYAEILNERKEAQNNGIYSYSDFNKGFEQLDKGLKVAFSNFQKLADDTPLKIEYNEFSNSEQNKEWLETSALFRILNDKYKTGFQNWEPIDRDLISLKRGNNPQAIERYNTLLTENAEDIELEKFAQFIAYKQIKDFQKNSQVGHIGDALIAFSGADVWANQEAFLGDKRLGCPEANWGFYTLNPDKIFNEDGTKGMGAKLIEQKFSHILDTNSSVRIDHVMGIVNPFLFDAKRPDGDYASNYDDLKNAQNYKRIIPEILVPLFQEKGIDLKNIVGEDLCKWQRQDQQIFIDSGISGISKANINRAENVMNSYKKDYWAVYGTHDNAPVISRIQAQSVNDGHNVDYLANYLNPLKQNDGISGCNYQNLYNLIELKFTEIIGKYQRAQISFMDFFGINETYNKGNCIDDKNWKLRVPDDYKQRFYDSFETEERYTPEPSDKFLNSGFTPINILKIYKDAVIAKKDLAITQKNKEEFATAGFLVVAERVVTNLTKLLKILSEKTAKEVLSSKTIKRL